MKCKIWNQKTYQQFIDYLFTYQDIKYQEFNRKLISTKSKIIGVKMPILRRIAKQISKNNPKDFLNLNDNKYYEVIIIKGLLLSTLEDINELNNYFFTYISLIDNWAVCDIFSNSLKIVSKNKAYFLKVIKKLIKTQEEFKIRFGLVLLLNYYIEPQYLNFIFKMINETTSTLYYINMARAWLLCECFIKYNQETLNYLETNTLDKFTLNKALSKIRDSYRVNSKTKEYILKFKR